jgi:catechol 2,3-dioxygenase-like lactoylglutathione lyase family enzyme
MPDHPLSFDHVHLVSTDPDAAAAWYAEKLGGEITSRYERGGAPQVFVRVGDATLIIRGQRAGEAARDRPGLQWGVDHFGFGVAGDFEAYCAQLEEAGVPFSMAPTRISPGTRIAFIDGPDGVSIELLQRGG